MSSLLARRCCLCLHCRTALLPGSDCDCSHAASVACFEVAVQREKIQDAAWDREPDRLSPRSGRAEKRMGRWRSIGGYLYAALATIGKKRARPLARGGLEQAASDAPVLRGILRGDHDLYSPASGHECLAYSLELRLIREGRELLMYRDAVTSGLVVEMGTGEELRIPAGRLRFAGVAPEILDVDNLELEAYLDSVDPNRSDRDRCNPLHFNIVREEVLFSGDTVDIRGAFQPVASCQSNGLYREAPMTHYHCDGIAEIRRV